MTAKANFEELNSGRLLQILPLEENVEDDLWLREVGWQDIDRSDSASVGANGRAELGAEDIAVGATGLSMSGCSVVMQKSNANATDLTWR